MTNSNRSRYEAIDGTTWFSFSSFYLLLWQLYLLWRGYTGLTGSQLWPLQQQHTVSIVKWLHWANRIPALTMSSTTLHCGPSVPFWSPLPARFRGGMFWWPVLTFRRKHFFVVFCFNRCMLSPGFRKIDALGASCVLFCVSDLEPGDSLCTLNLDFLFQRRYLEML